MKRKICIFILLALLFSASLGRSSPLPLVMPAPLVTPPEPPPTYPFRDAQPLDDNERKGHASLLPKTVTLKQGKQLTLHLTFRNTSGYSQYFYNPYFEGLIPPPGNLAIYNTKHLLVGSMNTDFNGSHRGVERDDWVEIADNAYLGIEWTDYPDLPPGTYYFQMIYFRPFADDRPYPDGTGYYLRYDVYSDRHELFRSNIVTVKVVK